MTILNKAALDKWIRNHNHHALEPIGSSSLPCVSRTASGSNLVGWLDLVTAETFTIEYGEKQ